MKFIPNLFLIYFFTKGTHLSPIFSPTLHILLRVTIQMLRAPATRSCYVWLHCTSNYDLRRSIKFRNYVSRCLRHSMMWSRDGSLANQMSRFLSMPTNFDYRWRKWSLLIWAVVFGVREWVSLNITNRQRNRQRKLEKPHYLLYIRFQT
jgi:hypothetical protein